MRCDTIMTAVLFYRWAYNNESSLRPTNFKQTGNVSKGHGCPHLKNLNANCYHHLGRRRTDGQIGVTIYSLSTILQMAGALKNLESVQRAWMPPLGKCKCKLLMLDADRDGQTQESLYALSIILRIAGA